MNQHWRQIGGSSEAEKSNEISLAAVNFNGICFKCGKKGHKASVCPENNKSEKAGSNKQSQGSKNKKRGSVIGVARLVILLPIVGKMRRMQSKGQQTGTSQ